MKKERTVIKILISKTSQLFLMQTGILAASFQGLNSFVA